MAPAFLELFWVVYSSVRAAVTKYHGLGDVSNRGLFSLGSGGWKTETKALAGLVSSEASLLGL
jgi:hypothetical protein